MVKMRVLLALLLAGVSACRSDPPPTPAQLDAQSVQAFRAMTDGDRERAAREARDVYDRAPDVLAGRALDDEPQLATALGRSIEVLAVTRAQAGDREAARAFLERELVAHAGTSIEKRIYKNINSLTMEGVPAPALDLSEHLGASAPQLTPVSGRVVLMFFWAHWCADCKAQAPILTSLVEKYGDRGLTIVAPTQRFGYVAGGERASPEHETAYIESVRQQYYPVLADVPIPLSAANHLRYGVSSTPTLVLVDRAGIVRLYHPGRMAEAELEPHILRLLGAGAEG